MGKISIGVIFVILFLNSLVFCGGISQQIQVDMVAQFETDETIIVLEGTIDDMWILEDNYYIEIKNKQINLNFYFDSYKKARNLYNLLNVGDYLEIYKSGTFIANNIVQYQSKRFQPDTFIWYAFIPIWSFLLLGFIFYCADYETNADCYKRSYEKADDSNSALIEEIREYKKKLEEYKYREKSESYYPKFCPCCGINLKEEKR